MIAFDTNLLVYAHRRDSRFHREAATAIREIAESSALFGIPWHCVVEFVAIVTNARIWRGTESTMLSATNQAAYWLEAPGAVALSEGPGFLPVLRELLESSGVSGGQVHDARIAAVCIHHGVSELLTADRDFSRFPRLRTRNPLVT